MEAFSLEVKFDFMLQINWGFSQLHLLKRANRFLKAREMKNTECQQNHKNPLIVQFEQHKCWIREQFHDTYIKISRKDIRCSLSSIIQNMSRTANSFHRIIHALLQLWLNNVCTLCKHLPTFIFVLSPLKAVQFSSTANLIRKFLGLAR